MRVKDERLERWESQAVILGLFLRQPREEVRQTATIKFGDQEYRARDVDFDVVRGGYQVLETEDGLRVRFHTTVTKVLVAVDDNGNYVHGPNGQPLVMVQSNNNAAAELSDEDQVPNPAP